MKTKNTINRRQLLKGAAASLVLFQSSISYAASNKPKKNFIWVLLRGGMDSLHGVVPIFDPDLATHRGSLIDPIKDSLLPLERGFGLHASMKNMHEMFRLGEMSAVVAAATPYRKRSHFDGQDLLESGKAKIDHDSGWLGRALDHYHQDGIAISRSVPISMRGTPAARTWYPSRFSDLEDDTLQRLLNLYEGDEMLSSRLQQALETNEMVGDMKGSNRSRFPQLAKDCAKLMSDKDGPSCAMLEMGGWDTHNNLVGRLDRQFTELDRGIAELKTGLGAAWKDTVVVVATEFGRTVRVNGTRGTDHGTASNMYLCGGALKGGKVLGEWPGLSESALYENRDLRPTSDAFDWIASLMSQHWQLSGKAMTSIFPDSKLIAERFV